MDRYKNRRFGGFYLTIYPKYEIILGMTIPFINFYCC